MFLAGSDGDSLIAADVVGIDDLRDERRDGSQDDPVAMAATSAASHPLRERISRDDVIAHLTFGFWTNRCERVLPAGNLFSLIAEALRTRF
jgi:hypothetical protein